MKVTITFELDGNDLEETDLREFTREAKRASGMNIEVGRPVNRTGACRMLRLSVEHFKVELSK